MDEGKIEPVEIVVLDGVWIGRLNLGDETANEIGLRGVATASHFEYVDVA